VNPNQRALPKEPTIRPLPLVQLASAAARHPRKKTGCSFRPGTRQSLLLSSIASGRFCRVAMPRASAALPYAQPYDALQ
jgi:hypothetical protein